MIFILLVSISDSRSLRPQDGGPPDRWQYPEGVSVHRQYWLDAPAGQPCLVAEVEADDAAAIVPLWIAHSGAANIAVLPVLDAEAGFADFRRRLVGWPDSSESDSGVSAD